MRYYHKKLYDIYYITLIKTNLKNNICIKQTKIEIQNESKTIVVTSVSKAVA